MSSKFLPKTSAILQRSDHSFRRLIKIVLPLFILLVGGGLLWRVTRSQPQSLDISTALTIPLEIDDAEVLPDPQGDLVQRPGRLEGEDDQVNDLQNTAKFSSDELNDVNLSNEDY